MAGPTLRSGGGVMAFLLLFLACSASGGAAAHVPVLMWSSHRLPPVVPPTAGHITPSADLGAYLTAVFGSGPQTVLLFLQDQLSQDDFTVSAGVFGNKQDSAFTNLEAALDSSSSVTFPAVEWAGLAAIPALLQQTLGAPPLLVDADALPHLSINGSVSTLLLVHLPYCSHFYPSCREVLQHNDEIIGKALSFMKSRGLPYSAIYTGRQPSRVIPESSVASQPGRRSLLQAVEAGVKPPIMFNQSGGPCIMLWAQNLSISLSRSATPEWIDLAALTPSLAGSSCNGTNSVLVLNYESGYVLSFFMSRRFYPVSARDWFSLDAVQLQTNGMAASFSGRRGIYAPAEYSFHCQSVSSFRDALLVRDPAQQNSSEWQLSFIDFQIQGFGLANGTDFSYASDCASFFTAGVWMGLLTTLLMLFIFVYGLHMILQLNTMDRFDDPKGPSISVPQSE